MATRSERSVRNDAQGTTRFVAWFRRVFEGN